MSSLFLCIFVVFSSDEKRLSKFDDESLKSCLYYIDLLMLLMDDPRNDINRDVVIHLNNRQFRSDDYTKSECLDNARYALSIARTRGCIFYLSPFDLVNVKSAEITMSFVMCIMVMILERRQKEPGNWNECHSLCLSMTRHGMT